MQNLVKTRKATYRQKFGNIGKLLVMEPPSAPLSPTIVSPDLITVGVQYDVSRPLSDPFDETSEPPFLPHPLEPSPVPRKASRPKMMDAATEFDMADGGGSPAPPLSNASSRDSLQPPNSAANGGSEHLDRMSVDLADISLSTANGAAIHGASETSDSGFSRSCASETSGTVVDVEEAPPSVFSDITSNSTTPDEGIEDPEPKINGTATPPEEDEDREAVEEEEEDSGPQPPSQEVENLARERQPSEGSLNDSVASSSQSSSASSQQKLSLGAKPLPPAPNTSVGRRGPPKAAPGKAKFSHVASRIDSGRRRTTPVPGKKRVTFEGLPTPAPPSDDNEPEEAENEEEEEGEAEDEEVFVIHPGPGFEEPPQRSHESSGSASRIVSFQEPRSLVKQYIKGRPPAGSRIKPRIIRSTTIETAELARKPQRAIPVPHASAHGGAPNIPVKQTNASKKRLEKLRQESAAQLERLQAESSYMTPLQRKEMEVKELRRQLGEAYFIIEQREMELDVFHHEKDREIRYVVEEKNDTIKELEESIEMLHEEVEALKEEAVQLKEREEQLKEEIAGLKEEAEKKETRHQQLYLEMYKKGRDSAQFERQDELENLALEDSNHVTKEELLKKLSATQMELEHWQMVKLTEHYDEAAKPETEAEAMLKFLKDSMFHYITDEKREDVDQHLRAIIRIFKFTDVQMKTINKCLEERKRKGKL